MSKFSKYNDKNYDLDKFDVDDFMKDIDFDDIEDDEDDIEEDENEIEDIDFDDIEEDEDDVEDDEDEIEEDENEIEDIDFNHNIDDNKDIEHNIDVKNFHDINPNLSQDVNNISLVNSMTENSLLKNDSINKIDVTKLQHINFKINIEAGSVDLSLEELSNLKQGDVLDFAGLPPKVKLVLNGSFIAEGYLVEFNGRLGVKLTRLINKEF